MRNRIPGLVAGAAAVLVALASPAMAANGPTQVGAHSVKASSASTGDAALDSASYVGQLQQIARGEVAGGVTHVNADQRLTLEQMTTTETRKGLPSTDGVTAQNMGAYFQYGNQYGCKSADTAVTYLEFDARGGDAFTVTLTEDGVPYPKGGQRLMVTVPADTFIESYPVLLPAYDGQPHTLQAIVDGQVVSTHTSTGDCRPLPTGDMFTVDSCSSLLGGMNGDPVGSGYFIFIGDNSLSKTPIVLTAFDNGVAVSKLNLKAGEHMLRLVQLDTTGNYKAHTVQLKDPAGNDLFPVQTIKLDGSCDQGQPTRPSLFRPEADIVYDYGSPDLSTPATAVIWNSVLNFDTVARKTTVMRKVGNGGALKLSDLTVDPMTIIWQALFTVADGQQVVSVRDADPKDPANGMDIGWVAGNIDSRPLKADFTDNVNSDGFDALLNINTLYGPVPWWVKVEIDGVAQPMYQLPAWVNAYTNVSAPAGVQHTIKVSYSKNGRNGWTTALNKSWTPLMFNGVQSVNNYVVTMDSNVKVTTATTQALVKAVPGLKVTAKASGLGFVTVQATPAQAKQLALATGAGVKAVEAKREVSAAGTQTIPQKGYYAWNLDRVDQGDPTLNGRFQYSGNGAGVNVYVVDTGIATSLPEYGGRASVGTDCVGDGYNGQDAHGHGSHVSGTIASTTYGAAKGARLISVRVLDSNGYGTNDGVVTCLDWIATHGVKPAVVNMSVGSEYDPAVNAAVDRLHDLGFVVVVAAGNNNDDACKYSPSSAAGAITVGASGGQNWLDAGLHGSDVIDNLTWFSNYGSCVNINAPGSHTPSVSIDGSWTEMSGTSMASPLVAGIAADYLSQNKKATPDQVRDYLVAVATPTAAGPLVYSGGPTKMTFANPTNWSQTGVIEGDVVTTGATNTTVGDPVRVGTVNLTFRSVGVTPAVNYKATVDVDASGHFAYTPDQFVNGTWTAQFALQGLYGASQASYTVR